MAVGLRPRLALTIAVFLIPAVAWVGYDYVAEREDVIEHVEAEMSATLALTHRDMRNLIQQGEQALQLLAEAPEVYATPNDCSMFLVHFNATRAAHPVFARVDSDGHVRCASTAVAEPLDMQGLPAIQATTTGTLGVGHLPAGMLLPDPTVAVAIPLPANARAMTGALLTAIPLGAIADQESVRALPQGSVFNLLDADGILLARSVDPGTFVGQRLPERAAQVHATPNHAFEATGLDGVRRLYIGETIDLQGTELLLVIGVPAEPAFAPAVQDAARNLALTVILVALVATGVILAVQRVALRPIDRMADVAAEVARGDRLARVGPDIAGRSDEIGTLARTLNATLDQGAAQVQDLERAYARLEELDHLKSRIIDGVAHELRTPLLVVDLQSRRLAERARLGDEDHDSMVMLRRNVERLGRLVENVIRVSDIQAGRIQVECIPVPLAAVLQPCVRRWTPVAQGAGLRLTLLPSDDWVEADAARFAEILDELIDNAVKFTPAGGAIEVRAVAAQDHVAIDVEDTGVGIDERDDVGAEPLERGTEPVHGGRIGVGVGLFIARSLTERMGGTLRLGHAGSRPGTCVTVRLPRAKRPGERGL